MLGLDKAFIAAKLRDVLKVLAVVLALCFPLSAHAGSLPSRDPRAVVPLLEAWHEHGSFAHLERILGRPDGEAIAGFSITEFKLNDGTSIWVRSTPSHNRIYAITRSAPGGLAQTLYEPLARDLDWPQPSSAPF
jgi:hypothetical protein